MFINKVTTHLFISTISLLLLAQFTACNVIRATEETDASTTENPTIRDLKDSAAHNFTKELIHYVFLEYTAFANESLYSLKNIFEKVIQDAYEYEGVHWKYLQTEVEPLKEFLSELEKLESDNNITGKYDLLADIAETLEAYNTTLISEPSDAVLYVEKLLKTHGLEELVNKLDIDVEHFVERLKIKVHEIWQKLPAEERGSDENLNIWLENFEQDSDLLKSFENLYSWNKHEF